MQLANRKGETYVQCPCLRAWENFPNVWLPRALWFLPTTLTRSISLRVFWLALASLVVLTAWAMWRAHLDVTREIKAVQALSPVFGHLVRAQQGQQAEASTELAALTQVVDSGALRHLSLHVGALPDAQNSLVIAQWQIADRASKVPVTLVTNPESEQRELWETLGAIFGGYILLALAIGLGVFQLLQRELRPLSSIVSSTRRVEGGALDERLPRFAVAEFDVIGQSMNHLTTTLPGAEASRQSLAARLHKVQEVERANIARDLHDDMGQQLTAMQANIAWLEKKLGYGQSTPALSELRDSCITLRLGMARTLAELRPGGSDGVDYVQRTGGERVETIASLSSWLESLVSGWQVRAGNAVHYQLDTGENASNAMTSVPPELALNVYPMTQEALSNIARHSAARRAQIKVGLADGHLMWCAQDDGCGIGALAEAMQRGIGLVGMRERA